MFNIGTPDRVIIGALLIAMPFFLPQPFVNPVLWWGAIAVGVALAATAALGTCPIYLALGIGTRRPS